MATLLLSPGSYQHCWAHPPSLSSHIPVLQGRDGVESNASETMPPHVIRHPVHQQKHRFTERTGCARSTSTLSDRPPKFLLRGTDQTRLSVAHPCMAQDSIHAQAPDSSSKGWWHTCILGKRESRVAQMFNSCHRWESSTCLCLIVSYCFLSLMNDVLHGSSNGSTSYLFRQ